MWHWCHTFLYEIIRSGFDHFHTPNPLRFHLFDKTTKKRSPLGAFKRSYKFFWHRFHFPSFSWLRMSVRSTPHHASAGRLWRCSEPLEDVVHNPEYRGVQSKIAQMFPLWTASLRWCYEFLRDQTLFSFEKEIIPGSDVQNVLLLV